ncbi:MAG: DEAD/DEAH box helicase [Bacteroidales bacterium]|nr:DEAD/DEAH box helicase [Candidatus Liminaster caballi]
MSVSKAQQKSILDKSIESFRQMAFTMMPLSLSKILDIAPATSRYGNKSIATRSLIDWMNYHFVEQVNYKNSMCYRLPVDFHLDLIEGYADEALWNADCKKFRSESLFDDELEMTDVEWLLKQMVCFLQGKPYLQEKDELMRRFSHFWDYSLLPLLDLLCCAMRREKWMPFMKTMVNIDPVPFYTRNVLAQYVNLNEPDSFIFSNYFQSGKGFERNDTTRRFYGFNAMLDVLKGDLTAARNVDKASADYIEKLSLALAIAYDGDSLGAVLCFEEAWSGGDIESDMFCYHEPFYLFIYAVCLKNSLALTDETGRKAIASRFKHFKKTFKDSNCKWMLLIADKALNENKIADKALDKIIQTTIVPMNAAILSIVLRFYYGYEEAAYWTLANAEKKLRESPYKLLCAELDHTMPERKFMFDNFCQQTGIKSPLRDGFVFVPKWERILDELTEQTKPTASAAAAKAKAEKLSRVIYNMWANNDCSQFSFTPRLQKSADGVNWTGGRNIALKTFGTAKEGLAEIDYKISRQVKAYSGWYGQTTYELGGKSVLELLVGHPNVYLEEDPMTPVSITEEGLQIAVERQPGGFVIKPNIAVSESMGLTNVVRDGRYTFKIIKITSQQRDLLKALSDVTSFPKEAEPKLAKFLGNLSHSTTILSDMLQDAKTNAQQVEPDSLITVRLRQSGDGLQADLMVRPFGSDGPCFHPAHGTEVIAAIVGGKSLQTKRDLKFEARHLEAVRPLMYEHTDETSSDLQFHCNSITTSLELLETLYRQQEHCRLEWPEGERWRIAKMIEAKDMTLTVKGAKSWFELDGELKVSETKILRIAELLERLHNGNGRFIQIGDTEFIALSDQLRRQLSQLESMASIQRKKIQVSQFSTSAIEGLKEAGVSVEGDKTYTKFIDKVMASANVKFTMPKGLQADLRDYQKEGVRWMNRLAAWGAGACLADDMGLGKTLQAITLMLSRQKEGPSLVVVPTSVTHNWRNEIERFAPQLHVLLMNTPLCDRQKMIAEAGKGDVIVTTYGLLVTEEELLCSRKWNMIVLDEAHTIKNKETKMSHAAMQLQGDFRLLLTGTPVQNHLGELWNLFQFSNPGLLGSNAQFQEKFIIPIEKNEDKERMRQLKRMVTPFILRRTKNEVLDELPEKSEVTINVQLSDEEMGVYENLRRQAVTALESGESSPMQTLAEITRLRQAACNARLIDGKLKLESSKLTTLLSMLDNLLNNGHRALIFSQFTSHLALVREALDREKIEYLYLDGSNTAREREKLVNEFQTGSAPLFLISLKAGGTGLNLTAADYVFHLDPWWNPAIEDQASDRTYRIGQTRPVTIYRLIAQQTIEEKIIRLHATKKSLADSLLAGTGASHKLTREEMLELLKG